MDTQLIAPGIGDAEANQKRESQIEADLWNKQLKDRYLSFFASLVFSVTAGKIDAADVNWPKPPNGWDVVEVSPGWFFQVQGNTPVCEQPSIPPSAKAAHDALVANVIAVGARLSGGWYAVDSDRDTWPANKRTPPVLCPDGETHQLIKIPAPVGSRIETLADGTKVMMGGWYEVVG